MVIKWQSSHKSKLLPISFGNLSTPSSQIFIRGANGWHSPNFAWTVTMDDDNSITNNGDGNEAGWFANGPDAGTLAITLTKWTSCNALVCNAHLTEADIYFYLNN